MTALPQLVKRASGSRCAQEEDGIYIYIYLLYQNQDDRNMNFGWRSGKAEVDCVMAC